MSALGNQLTKFKVNQIDLMESLPYDEPVETPADEIDVVGEEILDKPMKTSNEAPQAVLENPETENKPSETPKDPEIGGDSAEEGQTTLF